MVYITNQKIKIKFNKFYFVVEFFLRNIIICMIRHVEPKSKY